MARALLSTLVTPHCSSADREVRGAAGAALGIEGAAVAAALRRAPAQVPPCYCKLLS